MAKKKYDEIAESIEETVEEVIEDVVSETVEESDDYETFIHAQLKVINKMSDSAKAKRLAARVLRNRKGK